ncbi:hypothetical protein E2C01_002665 [Portunus trituberculatus]|uniref:Uncharacterized protein n=1 Tax=Portunus trituberculatus TaxID=210409 RepID=A0A5B7CKY0_PORTR|nr:hypothetical protein [Portunus trituberculatus]
MNEIIDPARLGKGPRPLVLLTRPAPPSAGWLTPCLLQTFLMPLENPSPHTHVPHDSHLCSPARPTTTPFTLTPIDGSLQLPGAP